MNKTVLNINGMHCKSCELLVEGEIKKIKGVHKVDVNYKNGLAEIEHEENLNKEVFTNSVKRAGYKIQEEENDTPLLIRNSHAYKDLGIAFLIFLILALLLEQFGVFNLNFNRGNGYSSIFVVLLVGLTAGFSTCMALVGGIILAISANFAKDHENIKFYKKFTPHLFFNFGRVFFFFILGGLTGIVGSFLQVSPVVQGMFTIFLSLVMIILGANLLGIFPRLNSLFVLPKKLFHAFKIEEKTNNIYSHSNSFLLGGLTFFLPCGFTQAMQLYAISTGSFIKGALTMSIFALGTIPGLLTVGTVSSLAKGNFGKVFFKLAGFVVIALALFNIKGGFNLTGLNIEVNSKSKTTALAPQDPNVKIENGYQVVRMNQLASGYDPNFFIIKKGLPVKWIIDSQEPYSCAASLVIPELKITKLLQKGDNTIEFTPTEIGLLKFTCSMGMYSGTFNVVDDKETYNLNKINQAKSDYLKEEAAKPKSGCGCSHGT